MDNWQLQHRRSLAFDEQRHQDVASIGKFDRVVMAMWHIWFDHTKLGNAEAGCSRPDPSLSTLTRKSMSGSVPPASNRCDSGRGRHRSPVRRHAGRGTLRLPSFGRWQRRASALKSSLKLNRTVHAVKARAYMDRASTKV